MNTEGFVASAVHLGGLDLDVSIDLHSTGDLSIFSLHYEGQEVSYLKAHNLPGREHVQFLYVAPWLRRQGLATFLWRLAQQSHPGLRHDLIGCMSVAGLAFASAVGGQHYVFAIDPVRS